MTIKREQCDNCGKFVAKTIGRRYSDDTGMITCLNCADTVESVSDEHINTLYSYYAGSNPIDQYADYFEDIQNGGLDTYYD